MTTQIKIDNIDSGALTTLTSLSTGLKISTIVYPGTETATNSAGGETINLTGSGFQSGCNILVGTTSASVVTFISSTQVSFVAPALSAGTYVMYVINPDGGTCISIPGLSYHGVPQWSTAAGTLGNAYSTGSFTDTVVATSTDTVTYSLLSGTLPTGATLNSSTGTISGTSPNVGNATTYTFQINATNAENQTTARTFSITINPDIVTWSSPTNNTTYTSAVNSAISNVTLSANSAAGRSITYTANALPTGLSISGANITGIPTATTTSSSLLTATAANSGATATDTINWIISVGNDTYFSQVTLLLAGNGTNGANNNTFYDGSTNHFAITRYGDTPQGTFSPYSTTGGSVYFDGSTGYLSISDNSAFNLVGDFTIECWINLTTFVDGKTILSKGYPGSDGPFLLYTDGVNNKISYYASSNGSSWDIASQVTVLSSPQTGTWYHIAITRSSNTYRTFANGVLISTFTSSLSPVVNASPVTIGGTNYINGYISNLRIVKGTALYTATFTPPTTFLTAISGTSLLTGQYNSVFSDNSSNNFTVTHNSGTRQDTFSPYRTTSSYSTSTVGGSVYLDGTGDYLTMAQNAAFNFGTGAFTVEAWVYLTAYPSGVVTSIISLGIGATGGLNYSGWALAYDSTSIRFYRYDGAQTNYTVSTAIPLNTWCHVVAVRNGSSNLSIFLNGTQIYNNASASLSYNNVNSDPLYVGYWKSGASPGTVGLLTGYVSDARIVNGTAVYDPTLTTLTVPTAPLTAITNTSLLLNFTNAGIIDGAMKANFETFGDVKISNAQSKYGGSSIYFDGSGDYLYTKPSANYAMGSGDFTIELWYYPISQTSTNNSLLATWNTTWSANKWTFLAPYGTKYYFSANNFDSSPYWLTSISIVTNNAWVHIAITRSGSTWRMFINGTVESTMTQSGALDDGTAASMDGLYIGAQFYTGETGRYINAYIDDLRITKGVARYTTNFTPPSALAGQ